MNKKLIAVAVASALGVPAVAWAQASTVQIYGRAYLEYGFIDQGNRSAAQVGGVNATSGALPDVDIFQTPGAMIGFKGEEKLGSNLSAWYQCESTADIAGTSAGTFCSRNSAVGLKGAFGSVYFGRWDTPFKVSQLRNSGGMNDTGVLGTVFLLYGASIGADGRGTINTVTAAAGTSNAGAWPRRNANTIFYDTPNWNGFQLKGAVSTIGGAGGALGASAAATGAKPRLWSLAATYDNGPLAISAAYEVHKNYYHTLLGPLPLAGTSSTGLTFNAVFGGTDKGWNVGASYTFPVGGGLKVGGIYTRQEYDTPGMPGAGNTDVDRHAWMLYGDWKIAGPHGLQLYFERAGSLSGSGTVVALNPQLAAAGVNSTMAGTGIAYNPAGDTGADKWGIKYYHALSKRTQLGAGYSRLDNDRNGRFAIGGAANPAAGEDQDGFMVYIDHRF